MKARAIAFYLPQYHAVEENDLWWGKGFTEWTNVGKAKPLFRGHLQPRVPSELGYYNLLMPEVRKRQAQLALEAGIEGFCYYHYWFGNKRLLLEKPFQEVLKSGEPELPFMLCWANESWHCKFWNIDGQADKKLLIEQTYPSENDIIEHFNYLLPAFKDKRYILIDGKPAFMIYKPLDYKHVKQFIATWNDLAVKNGLKGFYFIGQTIYEREVDSVMSQGFDAVNLVRLYDCLTRRNLVERGINLLNRKLFKRPFIKTYKSAARYFVGNLEKEEHVIPTIYPNWDHTPRSGLNGYVLKNSTPQLWGKVIDDAINIVQEKDQDKKLIFIKSWNEWGEGNFLEPDIIYGRSYIDILADKLK